MAVDDITCDLWNIARERGNLTDEELTRFSKATSEGAFALCLSEVVEGIGCLVADDANREVGARAGNFQGSDTGQLLWTISTAIKDLSAREYIAAEAAFLLMERVKGKTPPAKRKGKQ